MTYVWYTGNSGSRTVTGAQWIHAIGSGSYTDTTWNAVNGWSLPTASFDSNQLDILATYDDFLLAQSGEVREAPTPGNPAAVAQSNHAYYVATLALLASAHITGRVTRKVAVVTQSATPVINTDNCDVASITGLAQAITSLTSGLSGTPAAGDSLLLEFTDDGTNRAITHGAKFEASTVALATTTAANAKLQEFFTWNPVTSKWRLAWKA